MKARALWLGREKFKFNNIHFCIKIWVINTFFIKKLGQADDMIQHEVRFNSAR